MYSVLAKPLDWLAIQFARRSVAGDRSCAAHEAECNHLLNSPDFFGTAVAPPHEVAFTTEHDFHCVSPLPARLDENKTIFGKFYHCSKNWRDKPTVILLHGWNAELCYYKLFPIIAARLVERGVNAVMFQLPFHGRRRPHRDGVPLNFISGDVLQTLRAAQRSLHEVRSLMAWLGKEGSPKIGLWGFSLGAWLAGLAACSDPTVDFAVLATPITHMESAIKKLPFCKPIHRALQTASIPLDCLDLTFHQPKTKDILIIESQHDLFAPPSTVEDLWRRWHQPEIWRVPQGHISVLLSSDIMQRTADWIARAAI